MTRYYRDYFWKMGKPYGKDPLAPEQAVLSYKIVIDPYYKRLSVEKYAYNRFISLVYDSLFLDFRHLKPMDQLAWERETLVEEENRQVCLLRNHEDRAILRETLTFDSSYCRSCEISSVHGFFISKHHMYYKALNDPFDGVILYDAENHPVMLKTYETDGLTGEFTTLLEEKWDMEHFLPKSKEWLN